MKKIAVLGSKVDFERLRISTTCSDYHHVPIIELAMGVDFCSVIYLHGWEDYYGEKWFKVYELVKSRIR